MIRGVSALFSGEETSSHMNLSDLSCRMLLVFEVVVFCAATRIKAFFLIVALVFEVVVFRVTTHIKAFVLIDALEFEVVEVCLFNSLYAFVSCVVMVFEVTVCGVAVHIIFNVEVREVDGCFTFIQGDQLHYFKDLGCFCW